MWINKRKKKYRWGKESRSKKKIFFELKKLEVKNLFMYVDFDRFKKTNISAEVYSFIVVMFHIVENLCGS